MGNKMKVIGFIINPIAGMGGKVGLKGTDGIEVLREAKRLGAIKESEKKADKTIEYISENLGDLNLEILTCSGEMGENLCKKYNLNYKTIDNDIEDTQDYKLTEMAAKIMMENNVELLVFAGGDGTARNIYNIVRDKIPVIGIPTGVKIHSAVFAINPKNAGRVVIDFLKNDNSECVEAEVMDIDEKLLKEDRLVAKLYGYMKIPFEKKHIQSLKVGGISKDDVLQREIASFIVDKMEDGINYIIGPGTSTREIMNVLDLPYSLLGIDIVRDKKIIVKDANESQILDIVKKGNSKIIVSLIGGQGYIFGRGNHQISFKVLENIDKEDIIIISTVNKILDLEGRPMLVDTGNDLIDKKIQGYYRLIVGYDEEYVYKCEVEN